MTTWCLKQSHVLLLFFNNKHKEYIWKKPYIQLGKFPELPSTKLLHFVSCMQENIIIYEILINIFQFKTDYYWVQVST